MKTVSNCGGLVVERIDPVHAINLNGENEAYIYGSFLLLFEKEKKEIRSFVGLNEFRIESRIDGKIYTR